MGHNPNHRIFACTSCRHNGSTCRPGYALIKALQAAIDAAGDSLADDFEISGVACMTNCDRSCAIGYQAGKKAAYLFGDIDPDQDIDELVAFAKLYRADDDGWFGGKLYPDKMRRHTLARVPAMIMAREASDEAVQ